jgi:hypothetical protein
LALRSRCLDVGRVQCSVVPAAAASSSMTAATSTVKAAASHCVTAASHSMRGAASYMGACATISPVESSGNTYTARTSGDAAVVGMARPVVDAMIDVIVVVSFMSLPTTSKVPSIA